MVYMPDSILLDRGVPSHASNAVGPLLVFYFEVQHLRIHVQRHVALLEYVVTNSNRFSGQLALSRPRELRCRNHGTEGYARKRWSANTTELHWRTTSLKTRGFVVGLRYIPMSATAGGIKSGRLLRLLYVCSGSVQFTWSLVTIRVS